MTDPARMLIADDEAELRGLRQRYLNEQGLVVRAVADAAPARKLLARLQDPSNPRHIQTVWGVGYVFVPSPQREPT